MVEVGNSSVLRGLAITRGAIFNKAIKMEGQNTQFLFIAFLMALKIKRLFL